VLDQRRGDLGVVDQMAGGIERAEKELGVEIKIIESRDATEYEDNILAMVQWGADVVFTSFAPLAKPAVSVAKDYPDVDFVLIYTMFEDPPSNVQPVLYNDASVFYLAGAMAGMRTQSDKVAFGTGADIPEAQAVYKAFNQGLESVKSGVESLYAVYGSFEDVPKAKEVARSMFDQGADIFCEWGGKVGWGSCEAAQETGNYIVGMSGFVDMRDKFPDTIIGQMGVRFGDYIYEVIADLQKGNRPAGGSLMMRDISTGDVGFTFPPDTDEGFSKKQVNELNQIYEDLKSGKIVVKME
jgi:basic membrane protein A